MQEHSLGQKLFVEFVGVFALCFIGIAAIASAAARPDLGGGLVTIAFAHGLVIVVMVSAVGHISGGHFNPAVTAGAWAAQKIASGHAAMYILVQVAAGIAGAASARFVLPENIWQAIGLGTPQVYSISNSHAILFEAIATFLLVWVVFATAVDPEGAFGKVAGLPIGFTVVLGIMAIGAFTGGALNPARALGPALVGGPIEGWWIYWIGPIAGGVTAAALYDALILAKRGTGGAAVDSEDEMSAPHGWGAHGEDSDSTITNE